MTEEKTLRCVFSSIHSDFLLGTRKGEIKLINTLTSGFKPIQLLKLNTSLLSVISLIALGAMLLLIASGIVSADDCASKFADYTNALSELEDAQEDYDAALAEWEAAPWWKKAYYWTAVLYYRTKLEIATSKYLTAWANYLDCLKRHGSGGCDS